ncbi:response regulator [Ferrovibrio sp.]|uniref:response regulator n=1 Tax=Ferrovibrio sp. TaxID=1917215 RepID=UPI00263535A5|nr:response regulator [Ferrovibrio sp.]
MKPLPDTLPQDLTVMVVDPDRHLRNLLRRLLLDLGVRNILFAADAREALDLQAACGGPLDIVLSDLRLPDMDGLDLLRRMQEAQPGLSAVMLSWEATEKIVAQARAANLAAFLAKPVAPEQLHEKIIGALQRDRGFQSREWLRTNEGLAFRNEATTEMRALYDIWNQARGDRPMPPRDVFRDWELRRNDTRFGQHVFIVDVEPPKPRLRYSFVGDALLARLGWDVQGSCVDEQNFLYRRYAEPAYARVIRHRLPHYRRVGAIERMILFRYQRLLLPFGDESGVQTVLGYARPR